MKFGRQYNLRVKIFPALYQTHFLDYNQYINRLKTEKFKVSAGGSSEDTTTESEVQQILHSEYLEALRADLKQIQEFYAEYEALVIEEAKKLLEELSQTNDYGKEAAARIIAENTKIEDLKSFVYLNISAASNIAKRVGHAANLQGVETKFVNEELYSLYMYKSEKLDGIMNDLERRIFQSVESKADQKYKIAKSPSASKKVVHLDRLTLSKFEPGIHRAWIDLYQDGLGQNVSVPCLIAKGVCEGSTLGITAAIHGNELNGIPIIHQFFKDLDYRKIVGTIVSIPVVNVVGFQRNSRYFLDGEDLNRVMPGKEDGNCSKLFAYRFFHRVVSKFDYLVDLHTASEGKVNSLYVRADMNNEVTNRMATLQNPQIIVHNTGPDGSLRGACAMIGIPAITVEIGDPSRFQYKLISSAFIGVTQILQHFKMITGTPMAPQKTPILCSRSYWLFTDTGGILEVFPLLTDWVHKGDVIARVKDCFGDVLREYIAPCDGIVIGKNINPNNFPGDRILHLGIVSENFAATSGDGR